MDHRSLLEVRMLEQASLCAKPGGYREVVVIALVLDPAVAASHVTPMRQILCSVHKWILQSSRWSVSYSCYSCFQVIKAVLG